MGTGTQTVSVACPHEECEADLVAVLGYHYAPGSAWSPEERETWIESVTLARRQHVPGKTCPHLAALAEADDFLRTVEEAASEQARRG